MNEPPFTPPFRPPDRTDCTGDPVLYWFLIELTPDGGAPDAVRAQWVGVALPVRRPRPVEGPESFRGRRVDDPRVQTAIADGVPVEVDDALRALRHFERDHALQWWTTFFGTRAAPTALVFRLGEGTLLPASFAEARYPELADFDRW